MSSIAVARAFPARSESGHSSQDVQVSTHATSPGLSPSEPSDCAKLLCQLAARDFGKEVAPFEKVPIENGEMYRTKAQRFRAMVDRRVDADQYFVCGTKSTKKCCLPSCDSKLPSWEQVEFIDGGETAGFARAETLGYIPCDRCKPQLPKSAKADKCQVAGFVNVAMGEAMAKLLTGDKSRTTLEHWAKRVKCGHEHLHRQTRMRLSWMPCGLMRDWYYNLLALDAARCQGPLWDSQTISWKQVHLFNPHERLNRVVRGTTRETVQAGFYGRQVFYVAVDHAYIQQACILFCPDVPEPSEPSLSAEARAKAEAIKGYKPMEAPGQMRPAIFGAFVGADAIDQAQRFAPDCQRDRTFEPWLTNIVDLMHVASTKEAALPLEQVWPVRRVRLFFEAVRYFVPCALTKQEGKKGLEEGPPNADAKVDVLAQFEATTRGKAKAKAKGTIKAKAKAKAKATAKCKCKCKATASAKGKGSGTTAPAPQQASAGQLFDFEADLLECDFDMNALISFQPPAVDAQQASSSDFSIPGLLDMIAGPVLPELGYSNSFATMGDANMAYVTNQVDFKAGYPAQQVDADVAASVQQFAQQCTMPQIDEMMASYIIHPDDDILGK